MKLRAYLMVDIEVRDFKEAADWQLEVEEQAYKLQKVFPSAEVRFDVKERRDRQGAKEKLPRYRVPA